MSTAVVVILIVVAILAGTIVTLKTTTRQGMPPKDVIDRAKQRARAQDERDERDGS